MAVSRRGVEHQTVVEKVAANLDAELLDLKPWLSRGVEGLREWTHIVGAALEVEGGSRLGDVYAVMEELGVSQADCYDRMFEYDCERRRIAGLFGGEL